MEARLKNMKLAELHSLSNKKLLGVKIDDKKVKLPKAQLIANILKLKPETEIEAALVKYYRTPSEYPATEAEEGLALRGKVCRWYSAMAGLVGG